MEEGIRRSMNGVMRGSGYSKVGRRLPELVSHVTVALALLWIVRSAQSWTAQLSQGSSVFTLSVVNSSLFGELYALLGSRPEASLGDSEARFAWTSNSTNFRRERALSEPCVSSSYHIVYHPPNRSDVLTFIQCQTPTTNASTAKPARTTRHSTHTFLKPEAPLEGFDIFELQDKIADLHISGDFRGNSAGTLDVFNRALERRDEALKQMDEAFKGHGRPVELLEDVYGVAPKIMVPQRLESRPLILPADKCLVLSPTSSRLLAKWSKWSDEARKINANYRITEVILKGPLGSIEHDESTNHLPASFLWEDLNGALFTSVKTLTLEDLSINWLGVHETDHWYKVEDVLQIHSFENTLTKLVFIGIPKETATQVFRKSKLKCLETFVIDRLIHLRTDRAGVHSGVLPNSLKSLTLMNIWCGDANALLPYMEDDTDQELLPPILRRKGPPPPLPFFLHSLVITGIRLFHTDSITNYPFSILASSRPSLTELSASFIFQAHYNHTRATPIADIVERLRLEIEKANELHSVRLVIFEQSEYQNASKHPILASLANITGKEVRSSFEKLLMTLRDKKILNLVVPSSWIGSMISVWGKDTCKHSLDSLVFEVLHWDSPTIQDLTAWAKMIHQNKIFGNVKTFVLRAQEPPSRIRQTLQYQEMMQELNRPRKVVWDKEAKERVVHKESWPEWEFNTQFFTVSNKPEHLEQVSQAEAVHAFFVRHPWFS
ncbi:hypothetical protein T439DRAFT_337395 [Meredithblackwellia eburnea MCA 4105]